MKNGLKRLAALIVAGIMLIGAYGCSKDADKKDTSSQDSLLADISFDKKDGLPPVNDELKQIYQDALKLEREMEFAEVGLETKEDGSFVTEKSGDQVWYKVKDDRFGTYAELEKYYKSLFTEELAEKKLEMYKGVFRDINGVLYTVCGARGSDITYAGHYFTIDSVKESVVSLTSHIYNEDYAAASEPVYEKQEDESKYTVNEVAIEFVKNDEAWKLSKFELFY